MQVISTVDYMVAAGNEHGVITVFQIPKSPPDSLPDSLKPKQKKQVSCASSQVLYIKIIIHTLKKINIYHYCVQGGKIQHKWLT